MEIGRHEMGSRRRLGNDVDSVNASMGTTKLGFDIPEWLLMELLIRLPVKLVFRCKLVCKKWLSIILDPYFIGKYILRASMLPQSQTWTFIYQWMHDNDDPVYELLEDVYSSSRELKCPSLCELRCPTYPIFEKYRIVGVCNGMLLYKRVDRLFGCSKIYNICNPITRQWISLPPFARPFKHGRAGFVTRVENSILSSYRVVRIELPVERSDIIIFEVFVSEINEWKDFDVHIDRAIEVTCRPSPTALNGILHWVTMEHGIMAYDPYLSPDTLRFIALPCDIDPICNNERHGHPSVCDGHQGQLRYFEVSGIHMRPDGFTGIGVWILNDYSTADWCLQYRINSADILYDDIFAGEHFFPEALAFHPFDSDILYLGYACTLVSYNIKTRELKSHGPPVDDNPSRDLVFRPTWWWTYSFVIPPWPTSITPSSFEVC